MTLSPILNMTQGEPWESALDGDSEDFVMELVSEDVHGLPREQVTTPRGVQHHHFALDTGSAPRTPVNLGGLPTETPEHTPYAFPGAEPPLLPTWSKDAASEQQGTSEFGRLFAAGVFAAGQQNRQPLAPPFPMMLPPAQQQHRQPLQPNPFAPGVLLPPPHMLAAFRPPQPQPQPPLRQAGATPVKTKGAAPQQKPQPQPPLVAATEEVTRVSTRPDGALNAIMFKFTLRRADDVRLGLEVSQAQRDSVLVVQDVLPNGAIESWNRQAKAGSTPWKVVQGGDLVVQVNQAAGCDAMLRECGTKQLLQLTLVREAAPQEQASI